MYDSYGRYCGSCGRGAVAHLNEFGVAQLEDVLAYLEDISAHFGDVVAHLKEFGGPIGRCGGSFEKIWQPNWEMCWLIWMSLAA